MILHTLVENNLINPPKWLPDNTQFIGYAGSAAYGVSGDTSDMDCFGFCIPPRDIVFPFSDGGHIYGFGKQQERFRVWSQHNIHVPEKQKIMDFSVYNIVDFFHLAFENNPNLLDILYLPRRCILHSTNIAEHVREHRGLFLSKRAMKKCRAYAFSQASKIRNKTNSSNPKRAADIEKNGFDTKFAYSCVRLMLQCEQILTEHELDLERNSEILKSIRRGEWTLPQFEEWFTEKEKSLEITVARSTLRDQPDERRIKDLLIESLEMHYGPLTTAVKRETNVDQLVSELQAVLDRYHQT